MKGIVLDLKEISDSREVMESKEPPKIRWFIYIILIIVACAIVFACFFEIDEYIKVSGEIRTADASSSIISPASCKLKEINVVEGQAVNEGDILFVLDVDYAKEQKGILEEKLSDYQADLVNTELLMQSIENNTNYFENDSSDSKYYYRYEQYENGVLLTAQEIENSQLTSTLSEAEKENNLKNAQESITSKNEQLTEYKALLNCVYNGTEYNGTNELVNASYCEYNANYQKAVMLCNEYKSTYDSVSAQYNEASIQTPVTSFQVETAEIESESAYSAMMSYQSAYQSDIRTQIVLLENQLLSDGDNADIRTLLNEYIALKEAIEQGIGFNSTNNELQNDYNQYLSEYGALVEDYNGKQSSYQELYNQYVQQNSNTVTATDVSQAKISYESAQLDVDSIKNTYIFQLQSTISQLEEEINTLEVNIVNLELSLNGGDNLEEYEKLSGEKLKNEAIISINSEIDSLNENIASIETQLVEINETIKNSEIRASCDGTVTLVAEFNVGDVIQAGNTLCNLIPNNDELKVVLYIPENEISKIQVGQDTEYIFDAIPYSEYGKITGEIQSISVDSVVNELTGIKYYIAQADLSEISLKNSDGDIREVKTGMLVEAKTICGSKKAIVWLLEKINLID